MTNEQLAEIVEKQNLDLSTLKELFLLFNRINLDMTSGEAKDVELQGGIVVPNYKKQLLKTPTIQWVDIPPLNGWVPYSDSFQGPQYCKDANGFVHFRGYIKGGTTWTTIISLPANCRPTKNIAMLGISNGGSCEIRVQSFGPVQIAKNTGNINSYVSLAGVSFYAGVDNA